MWSKHFSRHLSYVSCPVAREVYVNTRAALVTQLLRCRFDARYLFKFNARIAKCHVAKANYPLRHYLPTSFGSFLGKRIRYKRFAMASLILDEPRVQATGMSTVTHEIIGELRMLIQPCLIRNDIETLSVGV